jgi:aromatic ring-opening dioxygenase LigB subunit
MPIITSAFLPPSPLLIPEIGKQNTNILVKTLEAYKNIANILKESEIELIIIISVNGDLQNNNISLNVHPELKVSFQDFGILSTLKTFSPALELADKLKRNLETSEEIIRLSSQTYLDHGCAVPLQLLTNNLKNIKVLPLFPAKKLDCVYHFQFGKRLGEYLHARPEKIAIIATGELSHRLKKNSPAGYSPKGNRFDNRIIKYLNESNASTKKIMSIDNKIAEEVMENGLKQLSLLLGAIGEGYQSEILAYQNNFGIGYLSAHFNLQVAPI